MFSVVVELKEFCCAFISFAENIAIRIKYNKNSQKNFFDFYSLKTKTETKESKRNRTDDLLAEHFECQQKAKRKPCTTKYDFNV